MGDNHALTVVRESLVNALNQLHAVRISSRTHKSSVSSRMVAHYRMVILAADGWVVQGKRQEYDKILQLLTTSMASPQTLPIWFTAMSQVCEHLYVNTQDDMLRYSPLDIDIVEFKPDISYMCAGACVVRGSWSSVHVIDQLAKQRVGQRHLHLRLQRRRRGTSRVREPTV